MACDANRPTYLPWIKPGIKLVNSDGDGYTMQLYWNKAYSDPSIYNIAYNIYYSTIAQQIENEFAPVIAEGPKYVSNNIIGLHAKIVDFIPGKMYYFVVRATQYDPTWYNITDLQQSQQEDGYLYVYPETLLSADIDAYTTEIPILDVDIFPDYGIIQVGTELIRYNGRDVLGGLLLGGERGFFGSDIRYHLIDGYDGYNYEDSVVRFWKGIEDRDLFIIQEQCIFNQPNEVFTVSDGYRVVENVGRLITDVGTNDTVRDSFPPYDFVGWRRTNPSRLFTGTCVDTYIGGENFCADGYNGINQQIRGIPIQQQADRLQETLLEQLGTGEGVVLLKRLWNGITCNCFGPNQEYADPRCKVCLGVGIVGGYEQYYNPRRKDSRILVRFGAATEDVKMEDAGLENYIVFPCWTLTYPSLNDRDVLIRFNPDGTEEFRYEILDVERTRLLYGETGKQNFKCQRVRKTSPIYQWRAIRSTADEPIIINTSVGILRGANNVAIPHVHNIVISNNIISINQINHATNISENHHHLIIGGIMQETLGHRHNILF